MVLASLGDLFGGPREGGGRGFDFLDRLGDRIANDPCLLVDILWVLVEEQAKAINVTDE